MEKVIKRPGKQKSNVNELITWIEKLSKNNYFGKVIISFQNGKICGITKEQHFKLEELRDD